MAEINVVNGMDIEKLEAFRQSLDGDPVILGLSALGIWEGHSGRSTVHIGPYVLGGDRIERPCPKGAHRRPRYRLYAHAVGPEEAR